MKRLLFIFAAASFLFPFSMGAAVKINPVMIGPKLTVGIFEGDQSIYPLNASADVIINLYKNQLWLRTDIITLTVESGSDFFAINPGVPFDVMFMGRYHDWYPYGFGGFGISVASANETSWTNVGLDLGGGTNYQISRGLNLFAEGGLKLDYTNPSVGDPLGFSLFIALGARFSLVW